MNEQLKQIATKEKQLANEQERHAARMSTDAVKLEARRASMASVEVQVRECKICMCVGGCECMYVLYL